MPFTKVSDGNYLEKGGGGGGGGISCNTSFLTLNTNYRS